MSTGWSPLLWNDGPFDFLLGHDLMCRLGFAMTFLNLGQHLTYAIRTHGCVLAGISTLARGGGE